MSFRGLARWVGLVLGRFLEAQRWTAIEEGFASSAWLEDSAEERMISPAQRELASDVERLRASGVVSAGATPSA